MHIVETWLPIFPGFYNTIFGPDEGDVICDINSQRQSQGKPEIDYDDCEWDYAEYENEVSKSCTEFIEKELKERGIVTKIEWQRIESPKFYNFTNDSIDVAISLSPENTKKIWEYLHKNKEEFQQYLEEKFTSCSGFISFHSNDVDDWFAEDYSILNHSLRTGSVLDFICKNEELTEYDMREYCTWGGTSYLSAQNYYELTKLDVGLDELKHGVWVCESKEYQALRQTMSASIWDSEPVPKNFRRECQEFLEKFEVSIRERLAPFLNRAMKHAFLTEPLFPRVSKADQPTALRVVHKITGWDVIMPNSIIGEIRLRLIFDEYKITKHRIKKSWGMVELWLNCGEVSLDHSLKQDNEYYLFTGKAIRQNKLRHWFDPKTDNWREDMVDWFKKIDRPLL